MATRFSKARTALIGLCCVCLTWLVFAIPAHAAPELLLDVKNGKVLHHHRAFDSWAPASLTKLMTAYVTFRALREKRVSPKSPVIISKAALAEPPSKMGFKVGTILNVKNALHMVLVKSANDISHALAEAVSGSKESFVAEMNSHARRLGMRGTVFKNPNGLPANGQVTTARDMALLATALMREFPEYRYMFRIPGIKFGKRTLRSYNLLLERYKGATGMKTGFICHSGFNLVASAKRNGRTLVAVVLGSRSSLKRAIRAADLLNVGFKKTGGLFSSSSGTRLQDLRPRRTPVAIAYNMRPHVCGARKKRLAVPARYNRPILPGQKQISTSIASTSNDAARVIRSASKQKTRKGKKKKKNPFPPYLAYKVQKLPYVRVHIGQADLSAPGRAQMPQLAGIPMPPRKPGKGTVGTGNPLRGSVGKTYAPLALTPVPQAGVPGSKPLPGAIGFQNQPAISAQTGKSGKPIPLPRAKPIY